jgi:hypothetical protein
VQGHADPELSAFRPGGALQGAGCCLGRPERVTGSLECDGDAVPAGREDIAPMILYTGAQDAVGESGASVQPVVSRCMGAGWNLPRYLVYRSRYDPGEKVWAPVCATEEEEKWSTQITS